MQTYVLLRNSDQHKLVHVLDQAIYMCPGAATAMQANMGARSLEAYEKDCQEPVNLAPVQTVLQWWTSSVHCHARLPCYRKQFVSLRK